MVVMGNKNFRGEMGSPLMKGGLGLSERELGIR